MEQDSCQSNASIVSDQSELDEDDSAFAKTPARGACSPMSSDCASSCVSSDSSDSAHVNESGRPTYFHVWSDMLTCQEMARLDQRTDDDDNGGTEEPWPDQKPLSIDTSMPCPLIQFGPIPKKRPEPPVRPATSAAAAAPPPEPNEEELSGDQVHQHDKDERCCDFSLVAAKNKARLRELARLRRREQKRLVRY